jgi:hypothetical protein
MLSAIPLYTVRKSAYASAATCTCILHLVEVTAVLELETPTGPLTFESVHVSPVPSARTE